MFHENSIAPPPFFLQSSATLPPPTFLHLTPLKHTAGVLPINEPAWEYPWLPWPLNTCHLYEGDSPVSNCKRKFPSHWVFIKPCSFRSCQSIAPRGASESGGYIYTENTTHITFRFYALKYNKISVIILCFFSHCVFGNFATCSKLIANMLFSQDINNVMGGTLFLFWISIWKKKEKNS